MSDSDAEAEEALAIENSYYVRRKGEWLQLNTDSFTIGGRAARLMVVQGNKLVLLDQEQATRILRKGEDLRYVPIETTRRDAAPLHRGISKPKKKKNKLEPLLQELNSHMSLLTKLMIKQWTDRPKSNVKEIADTQSTSVPVVETPNIVSADIHEKPATEIPSQNSTSDSTSEALIEQTSSKSSSEGKKREFVVSPGSIRAISKFSQQHLDLIEFRGRAVVSPQTFDNNDDYCRALLHKLNPVVEMKRSFNVDDFIERSRRMLKETTGQKLPLNRFAATLGLVGTEKKKFMSDILEQRRRIRKTVQKNRNYKESNDFMTDSSAVDSDVQQPTGSKDASPKKKKTKTTKRKRKSPVRASKRLKSECSWDSISLSQMPLTSDESSDDTPKQTRKNKPCTVVSNHDKENHKHPKITTQSKAPLKAGEKIPVVKLKKTNLVPPPLKRNRVLRAANISKIHEKESQNASSSRASTSIEKSPLKRPDLVRVVEEDTSTIIAKQTKINRLGEASPEKSPNNLRKRADMNKTDVKQDKSTKINTSNTSSAKLRVYSMLEDKAILDYILKENNQRLVKGTMLWKALQKCFYSLAGQSRTWQSLKNRYLKYILPNLKYYGLPYDKEKLLRSGEYLGEITRKKKTSKDNSIFKTQPVISASNVLRHRNKSKEAAQPQNAEPTPSTSKVPASSTPKQSPRRGDPSYSDLTRRFQQRRAPAHGSDSSSSDFEPTAPRAGTRKLFSARP